MNMQYQQVADLQHRNLSRLNKLVGKIKQLDKINNRSNNNNNDDNDYNYNNNNNNNKNYHDNDNSNLDDSTSNDKK